MPERGHYILTRCAEIDLHEAKAWSQHRWGKTLTQEYFSDLHQASEYVAMNHQNFYDSKRSRRDTEAYRTGRHFIALNISIVLLQARR